jgi:hypothetical protein
VPILVLAGGVLLALGDAGGVTMADTAVAHRILTKSTFTAGRPSEPSRWVLRRLGQYAGFDDDPAAVLTELHRGLGSTGDR